MAIKKILLPVDFSTGSQRAVQVAADMASRLGAEVDVLHVWDPDERDPREEWLALSMNLPAEKAVDEFVSRHVVARVREVVRQLRDVGIVARGRWEPGEPAASIVAFALSDNCSAIVMGTSGRSGCKEAMIGSCAERVVRRSPIPVLVVPSEPAKRTPSELRGRWVADEGPLLA